MKYQTKAILAGFMGNFVEAYDVAICYYLSSELSRALMGNSQGDPRVVLVLIFLAYMIKPLGSFALGIYSDRYGRKKVMIASIVAAGITTMLIGLIPGYTSIGSASIAILLGLRIAQSIAIGSEFLNSSSFLVESGDNQHRGFRGCWSSVGVKAGTILACICAEGAHQLSMYHPFFDFAWRLPFLLAGVTMTVGLLIRFRTPESLNYVLYYANRHKPTTRMLYQQSLLFIKHYPFLFRYAFFSSFLSIASSFFFYLYMPLQAIHAAHISRSWVTLSTLLALILTALLIPVFGWISDKRDRLHILSFSTSGLLMLTYPFMLIMNSGDASQFLLMQLLIAIPCAGYYSVGSVLLTELFPIHIRCTALSITFSIAASIAAGLPPVIAEFLIQKTHSQNAPSLIIITIALIMLYHIYKLAKHYRCGRNEYHSIQWVTSDHTTQMPHQNVLVKDSDQ
jgi:MHS family proline/betaine transporter-like MFS transporter